MMRILTRLRSEPWAITRETMETIIDIAHRDNESPQAVAAKLGRELENTYDAEIRDGVAILSVTGPLFRYANLFTAISGATSYDILARDFNAALENPQVRSILLNIDSPGGEASGVSEFADMIAQARDRKPVVAYVGGMGASAAYWLAAATSEIVVNDTAMLGSIGVVLGIEDSRERDAKNGVRRMEIVSAVSPYKRTDPASDEGRSRLQARVDALADVFVGKVAAYRGVTRDTVAQEFGQGDVFVGQAAVDAGLADRVGSFEAVLAEMQMGKFRQNAVTMNAAASGMNQEFKMDETNGAPAADNQPNTTTASAADAQATTTAQAAAPAQPAAAGQQDQPNAAASERARIQAILGAEEADGRQDLAHHLAFETAIDPEAARALLAKAPKATAASSSFGAFASAMAREGNADVGADAEPSDPNASAEDRLVKTAQAMGLA